MKIPLVTEKNIVPHIIVSNYEASVYSPNHSDYAKPEVRCLPVPFPTLLCPCVSYKLQWQPSGALVKIERFGNDRWTCFNKQSKWPFGYATWIILFDCCLWIVFVIVTMLLGLKYYCSAVEGIGGGGTWWITFKSSFFSMFFCRLS